ncbi:MAG: hypothetical protein KF749_13485 [Bacteroidetes bacterium]|nr:hypothetical protein [Bacteroidota bacterium]
MEEQILKEILQEMKGMRAEQEATREEMKGMRAEQEATRQEVHGMRQELGETNSRLQSLEQTTNKRFESLEQTTNRRFESLEQTTNKRFQSLESRFDGLQASVQVLTQGFSDVRYELVEIKKLLATRVIWNNDTVSFQVREGETLYGIIRKEEKKE